MSKYILLTISLLWFARVSSAQNQWKSKGRLYADKNIAIEIEYSIAPDGCSGENNVSRFRYRITRIKPLKDYYINWRFDFFNCDNELKTQMNSLHILRTTKAGILTPEMNFFTARKMSNYFNDVKASADLPEIGFYKPISTLSMEPVAINGRKNILNGDSTRLTLSGGSLGTGAHWEWYAEACGGKLLGTGSSITFSPDKTLKVFVRANGNYPSPCITTEIEVKQGSQAAKAISGRNEICEGEQNVTLNVTGGRLFGQAKWVWYAESCAGERIGEGQSINVSPQRTTTYFVRAEDGKENTTCQSFTLAVKNKSVKPFNIEGAKTVSYGSATTLKIISGYLAPGAKWVWYKGTGTPLQAVGTGITLSTGALYSNEVFSVRAEGDCNQTDLVSYSINIANNSVQTSESKVLRNFFLNGGIAFTEISNISKAENYVLTIGSGGKIGWFLRTKLNIKNTGASFQTSDISIGNYNLPGYYNYNGQTISKRLAYTGGIFFGGYKLSAYVGGGYGTRDLMWGIDQFRYEDNTYSTGYAQNTSKSYKGAEIELGVMLRLGFVNVMGGASSIQFKYTDFNLGIGFNL